VTGTWRRRAVVCAFAAAAAFLLASCGLAHSGASASSRPWWYQTGTTTCATPAWVRVEGQVIAVGDCAGLFLVPARQVTVQAGQRIDVRMTEEYAGPSGNQLVPMFPLPHSSRPAVLADGAASQDRASETYRAMRPGHAVLTTQGWCLAGGAQIHGSCPVLDVTVVASAQA